MNTIHIRLFFGKVPQTIHDGQPTLFGLQDTAQQVHPGSSNEERSIFICELRVNKPEIDPPVFSGVFVHGPPKSRFLYLSWKRLEPSSTPWIERIKIPLAAISTSMLQQALTSGGVLEADVTARRPHQTTPVVWKVEK